VEEHIEFSRKTGDSYFSRNEPGATSSAKLKVADPAKRSEIKGWGRSGSFAFLPEVLKINEDHTRVMLPAEAKKYSSDLNFVGKNGQEVNTTIEVNKPFHMDGWSIYQLGYDTEMGRWSELSVLQLVRDPWLPVVYLGIFLMMAGAGFLFITGKPKNGGAEHVD
jgi:cytochrome c biogenesis protein ResB